jgi:hypothetical protein
LFVDRAELTGDVAGSVIVVIILKLQELENTLRFVLSRYLKWQTGNLNIPNKPVGANFPVSEEDERAPQVFAGNEKNRENEIQATFSKCPGGNRKKVELYNLTASGLVIPLVWCNLETEFLDNRHESLFH